MFKINRLLFHVPPNLVAISCLLSDYIFADPCRRTVMTKRIITLELCFDGVLEYNMETSLYIYIFTSNGATVDAFSIL